MRYRWASGEYANRQDPMKELFIPLDLRYWSKCPGALIECRDASGGQRDIILGFDGNCKFSIRWSTIVDSYTPVIDAGSMNDFTVLPDGSTAPRGSIASAQDTWNIVQSFYQNPDKPNPLYPWVLTSSLNWPESDY